MRSTIEYYYNQMILWNLFFFKNKIMTSLLIWLGWPLMAITTFPIVFSSFRPQTQKVILTKHAYKSKIYCDALNRMHFQTIQPIGIQTKKLHFMKAKKKNHVYILSHQHQAQIRYTTKSWLVHGPQDCYAIHKTFANNNNN